VPGGTVDFMTITRGRDAESAIARATVRTAERSAAPVTLAGVPTATNTTSPRSGAQPSTGVENAKRPEAIASASISSMPGS
jgi:hypothetical protein